MFVIKLLIIFIFSFSFLAQAGNVCPLNMIADSNLSYRQSANFNYACTCPDGRKPNYDLNAQNVKFGTCRDVGEYKLDLTKFDSSTPNKLELWFDAADINGDGYLPVVPQFNPPLGYWKDKSGKNLYLFQADANLQPILSRSIRHVVPWEGFSKPFVSFNNNNANFKNMLSLANNIDFSNGFSLFIVFDVDPAAANSNGAIFAEQNFATNFGLYHNDGVSTNNVSFKYNLTNKIVSTDFIFKYDNVSANPVNLVSVVHDPEGLADAFGSEVNRLDFYLHPFQQKYSSDNMYLSPHMSGRQNLFTFVPTVNIGTLSQFIIGGHPGNITTGFQGGIGEIILFSRPLSHGERAEIEAYLRRKWIVNSKAPNFSVN